MRSIIHFIKYHNLVPIILGLVLLLTASTFASEGVRNAVIGEKIVTEQGIDNSQILAADLDNFDMALQILNVTEDAEKYYIDYTFRTIAIQDNRWQEVWREKRLAVSKKYLGDGDLTLYVAEELGQVIDNELAYLREVQEIEREKGLSLVVASVEYTGLRGLLSVLKEKLVPEPICQPVDEVCDGVDNDCDGLVDEDLGQTSCGTGVCLVTVGKCLKGALVACVPGTPSNEICGDNIDNNCDGVIDNAEICQVQPPAQPVAQPPVREAPVCQPTMEICDGFDNDCDGMVDEGGICETAAPPPEEPPVEEEPPPEEPPVCEPIEEICNGLDDDCDGLVDEDLGQTTCGVGACEATIDNCVDGVLQTCVPGTPSDEICDGLDNNCDGQVDENGVCEEPEPEPEPEPETPSEETRE